VSADHGVERWIVAHRAPWLDWLFEELSRIGEGGTVWLLLALVLTLVRREPRILLLVALADLAADLAASALKAIIPRHRPHVHALVAVPHTHSFPSGHAATSFACATVLAGLEPRLRVPLFLLAAAVAYSRLYNGVHWPLDVLGGAVLGVAVGCGVRALRLPAARRPRSPRGPRTG
jgi:undecaprenyl-diphosphatase